MFGHSNSRVANVTSASTTIVNARQFILNEILTYYQQSIVPELYCLGVCGERFIPLLEEIAREISPEIVLNEQQQNSILERLLDISMAMFDGDNPNELLAYKALLRDEINACSDRVSL
jgi:hypothetical protein